ncbi:FUSC family protein [Clostridium sp. Sa3CUN1]|uniref:FUSC family protein n=1 Tax=Clostridium gallinarum TaxID=2762246 RepID=A0ABR8Q6B0_9CLOT|nr:FUSC family protein [Clostridium gallinarum]MBD7915965.1 FUSC family protein [Clostridium gallinarum]
MYSKNMISKYIKALPETMVSLIIFFSNQLFFGMENSIMGIYMTLAFKKKVNKFHNINEYFKDLLIHFFIVITAFVATINLPLTILINLIVCFILVYTLTDEYNHTDYFHYVMGFILLQSLPITLERLPYRLIAMVYSNTIVYIGFKFFSPKKIYMEFNKLTFSGLNIIKDEIKSLLSSEFNNISKNQEKILLINKEISNLIYENRRRNYFTIISGQGYFPFSTLFQHFNIFIDELVKNKNLLKIEDNILCLQELVNILEYLPENFYLGNNDEYVERLIKFTSNYKITDNYIQNYLIYIINLLASILDYFSEDFINKSNLIHKEWVIPSKSRPLGRLIDHFTLNSFKLRFALRLSIVVSLGFTLEKFLNLPKGYWLPLNIFVLIIPFYEDSFKKVVSRIKGTLIGIILSFILFTIFKTRTEHMIIMALSNLLIYSMNNYASISIYITCSSLAIASLTMGTEETIILRFLYVFISAGIALLANRFMLQSNNSKEVVNWFNKLIRLDRILIRELNNLLTGSTDSNVIREILLKVNLVSNKIQLHSNSLDMDIDIRKYLQVNCQFIIQIEHIINVIEAMDKNRINKDELSILTDNMNKILDIIEINVNNNNILNNISLDYIKRNEVISDSNYITYHLDKCIEKINELYYISKRNLGS